ncbi:SGNH/GDSL hydrolase family protein [Streptomyces sp. NPDC023723]|uniref:SGNH/GDSL hydrolase family protein n=1 Tax=Streptomyces sp. NPDC023723 TaxID=3154323 RepID=UPI00340F6201
MIRVKTEPLPRGVLPSVSWVATGSRLPVPAFGKLTVDTLRAARVPAGVRLAFTGTASVIELLLETGEWASVPAPTVPDALVIQVPGRPPRPVGLPAGRGTARLEFPERNPAGVVRVYLPEATGMEILELAADRPLEPVPRGPLRVVYGGSITRRWPVSTPGPAWPSRVADALGLDLVDLGFAGAARGELPTADVVAVSGADAATLAWGTNGHSAFPTSAARIAETMRFCLTTVREGLPVAPITGEPDRSPSSRAAISSPQPCSWTASTPVTAGTATSRPPSARGSPPDSCREPNACGPACRDTQRRRGQRPYAAGDARDAATVASPTARHHPREPPHQGGEGSEMNETSVFRLDGRVAVVTGGGSGTGRATVEVPATAGARADFATAGTGAYAAAKKGPRP